MSANRRPKRRSEPAHRQSGGRGVADALANLAQEVRRRLAHHPQGHLASTSSGDLEITVRIPLGGDPEQLAEATDEVRQALASEVEALLLHRAVFQPGRLLDLNRGQSESDDSAPPDPRSIFAGYGATGKPIWADFGQYLLEKQDPRVDLLYRRPPALLTRIVSGRELSAELLPAFREHPTGYRIHGQVIAGWFVVPRVKDGQQLLALTLQVISSAGRRGRRRLGLNVLGASPGGQPLEDHWDGELRPPWSAAAQWGQSVLVSIERSQGRKSTTPEQLSQRIEGLLGGIARRLEQDHRSRQRRTDHAQKRHQGGDRPTRMALQDLARASAGAVFHDTRQETLVVLGERGRAHVFTAEGKLVTSVRYTPESIARKQKLDLWRRADEQTAATLRQTLDRKERD